MTKCKKKIAIFLTTIFFSLLLCSCVNDAFSSITGQIYALNTVIDITAYGANAQQAVDAATAEIYRLEKLLSVTDENSEIYKLNNSKGEKQTVSNDTYTLLDLAKKVSAESQGKFDPTVYPVLKLWGFTQGEYAVPSDDEIAVTLDKVNSENILLGEGNTVSLQNGAQVDLGGIAKGYIADKAANAMKEAGCTSGLISLGGNVRTIGEKPDGTAWNIGIKDPEGNGYFATLTAQDRSVITSGAYQRNFTKDGVTYHHIIDSKTGKPSESNALSVTIIGKDGAVCDALSTAIFVGGTEFTEKIHAEAPDFEYIILTKDNKLYVSQGLKRSFSLSEVSEKLDIVYQ